MAVCSPMNDGQTAREFTEASGGVRVQELDEAVLRASKVLLGQQHQDGHWVFELEADTTIPSEYILLQHYLGRIEPELQARIARYIRAAQGADGGWPLFYGGALDISCSVKAYFALKAVGDPVDAPHMARARAAILARGGARRCNVFTRFTLALFGEVSWRAVPVCRSKSCYYPAGRRFILPRSPIGRAPFWCRCSC